MTKTMTPPDGLPPLPPNTRYGGRLKDYDGLIEGHTLIEGCPWDEESHKWSGMRRQPHLESALWHIALPLPEVDARCEARHAGEEQCTLETALTESRAEVESGAQAYNAIALDHERQRQEIARLNETLKLITERSAELTSLREENRRLREWQPIETAPKDGTKVDLWGKDKSYWGKGPNIPKRWADCYWLNDGGFSKWTNRYGDSIEATHWRPLPAAPNKGVEDE